MSAPLGKNRENKYTNTIFSCEVPDPVDVLPDFGSNPRLIYS